MRFYVGPMDSTPTRGQGVSYMVHCFLRLRPSGNLPERMSALSSGQLLLGGGGEGWPEALGFINLNLSPGLENTANLTHACGMIVSGTHRPKLLPSSVMQNQSCVGIKACRLFI